MKKKYIYVTILLLMLTAAIFLIVFSQQQTKRLQTLNNQDEINKLKYNIQLMLTSGSVMIGVSVFSLIIVLKQTPKSSSDSALMQRRRIFGMVPFKDYSKRS